MFFFIPSLLSSKFDMLLQSLAIVFKFRFGNNTYSYHVHLICGTFMTHRIAIQSAVWSIFNGTKFLIWWIRRKRSGTFPGVATLWEKKNVIPKIWSCHCYGKFYKNLNFLCILISHEYKLIIFDVKDDLIRQLYWNFLPFLKIHCIILWVVHTLCLYN